MHVHDSTMHVYGAVVHVTLFLFSLRTKSILVASYNYGWPTDVTWTILTMFFLHFWALNVSVALLSMELSESFHKNILICVPKMNEGLTGLEQHKDE